MPSVEWCASAGMFGALCQNSIDRNQRRQMSLEEWVEFLSARPDDPSTPQNEEKGPALCTSSADFAKVQIALETLCAKAGKFCSAKEKAVIQELKQGANTLKVETSKIKAPIQRQGRTAPATGKSK